MMLSTEGIQQRRCCQSRSGRIRTIISSAVPRCVGTSPNWINCWMIWWGRKRGQQESVFHASLPRIGTGSISRWWDFLLSGVPSSGEQKNSCSRYNGKIEDFLADRWSETKEQGQGYPDTGGTRPLEEKDYLER